MYAADIQSSAQSFEGGTTVRVEAMILPLSNMVMESQKRQEVSLCGTEEVRRIRLQD